MRKNEIVRIDTIGDKTRIANEKWRGSPMGGGASISWLSQIQDDMYVFHIFFTEEYGNN